MTDKADTANASTTKTGTERVLSVRRALRISNRQSTAFQSHNLQLKFEKVYSRTLSKVVIEITMDTKCRDRDSRELELERKRSLGDYHLMKRLNWSMV